MSTMAPELPPVQQDPAFTKAMGIRRTYEMVLPILRQPDPMTTEVMRAANVVKLYNDTAGAIASTYNQWEERVQARLSALEASQPVGPDIPATANAADRQVLLAAFRGLLKEARAAGADERQQMYRDALSFGDETMRRAVLTALVEEGKRDDAAHLLSATDPGAADALAEWVHLRSLLGDGSAATTDALFLAQAFSAIPAPPEVGQLPHLASLAGVQVDQVLAQASYQAALRKVEGDQ